MDAPRQAILHTLIDDISGIDSAVVVIRAHSGERRLPLLDRGTYPCRTGASRTAHHYSVMLPEALGCVRYFVEATDRHGNRSRGSVEDIFLP